MRRFRRNISRRSISQYQQRQYPKQVRSSVGGKALGKAYIPDVRPFMRQFGYQEGLEEILQEIECIPNSNHFYYERGDLWQKNR